MITEIEYLVCAPVFVVKAAKSMCPVRNYKGGIWKQRHATKNSRSVSGCLDKRVITPTAKCHASCAEKMGRCVRLHR